MRLGPGTRVGPYEITAPLGAGGMGEVYRANDARLKRAVALKVLPDEVARDPERLGRFEREAHLLASLNHPNIGAIYGVEESGGTRCLVLELVEGQTLAARLESGAIPAGEAARLALQIAEALEAAHEKGIVHRDLKPANVMLTPGGAVKVLDFGLAKAFEGDTSGAASDLSLSPTLTAAATRAGIILGTAAYMSPEQARGKAVDRRSDVWAFGVILFEMLSGQRLFGGETVSDTLAGVLRADLDWKALPRDMPAALRRLLQRCLERDPRLRLRDIGEARIVLADVVAGRVVEEAVAAPAPARRAGWPLVAAGAALAAAAAAALAAWYLKPSPVVPLRRFHVAVEDLSSGPAFSVSPDGRSIAYAAKGRLWIRRLDKLEASEVSGTTGASFPFWSPDSQWIGYMAEGKLRKVAVTGGESAVISKLPDAVAGGVGASWGEDGRIAFGTGNGPLFEVPARGGDARPLLQADTAAGEDHFHEPTWLPGQQGLLYTVHHKDRGIDTLAVLADGKRKILLSLDRQEIWRPVYSSSGHILFRRQPENEGIWALPFSLSRLEPAGEPFLVVPGGNLPSASEDGSLVFRLGASSGLQQLVWVDRKGEVQGLVGQVQPDILVVALSPDGRRAAVQSHEGDNWDVWVHDLARATKTRLTFDPRRDWYPAWSPGGDRVVYVQERTLMIRPADGTGQAETLGEGDRPVLSPDGRHLVYQAATAETKDDIWVRPLDGDGQPVPFLQTKAGEWSPRVSPDGRYVVYASDESGHPEVYLTRFPVAGGKWQVSVDGGNQPIWSPRGDEILYRDEDVLMAVKVQTQPAPVLGTPQALFDANEKGLSLRPRAYDVSPDGRRILTVKRMEKDTDRDQLIVVTNWYAEFAPAP